jgi:50S ribosomal subunit-associated GTPase HflX
MERPNPKTFVGPEKIEEIHQYVKRMKFPLIFDDELSPSQQKNISKVECKIRQNTPYPRYFAQRAETSYAEPR